MLSKDSALQRPLLDHIQRGTMSYSYKGVPCLKNPFDLALYQMLVSEVRPRTIVEIGSHRGGSALWFADLMKMTSLPPNVHSVDVEPVNMTIDGVTFYRGDANDLSVTLTSALMWTLPRPWLVIEDASHYAETTLAVLEFFYSWLEVGEYIVIEDGIVRELGIAHEYNGGPVAAISRFMTLHPGDFEVNRRYCDWFGDNVTYNIDGFLRRINARPAENSSVRAHSDLHWAASLQKVKQQQWFYDFELPDGSRTTTWLPAEIAPIHRCRREKLRQVILDRVANPNELTAIDLAAHEGYFTFELARHFSRVDAYELRPESISSARLMADVLDLHNVTFTQIDLRQLVFNPALIADFVLIYGLLYHLEDPVHLLRLASQLARRHLLIETQVFPYDLTGRIEDGYFENQRNVEGVFSLSPDFPHHSVGGSTNLALVPSVNALISIMRTLDFVDVKVLEFDRDDYEQFRRGSRVIVYGEKRA
jgi:cephalosporin hydroxylase